MAQTVEELLISIGVTGAEDAESAFKKMSGAMKKVQSPAKATNRLLVDFGRVTQDAAFGPTAIANNLEPLIMSFKNAKQAAGGTLGAMKNLALAFVGPAGIVIAIASLLPFLDRWRRKQAAVTREAKAAKVELDGLAKAIEGVSIAGDPLPDLDPEKVRAYVTQLEATNKEIQRLFDIQAGKVRDAGITPKQAETAVKALGFTAERLKREVDIASVLRRQLDLYDAQTQARARLGSLAKEETAELRRQITPLEKMAALAPTFDMVQVKMTQTLRQVRAELDALNVTMSKQSLNMIQTWEQALPAAIDQVVLGLESVQGALKGILRQMLAMAAKMAVMRGLFALGGLIPTGALGGFGGLIGSVLRSPAAQAGLTAAAGKTSQAAFGAQLIPSGDILISTELAAARRRRELGF